MKRVAIVTDSAADLAPEAVARAEITVVPAQIRLGEGAIRQPQAESTAEEAAGWPLPAPPDAALVDLFERAMRDLASRHAGIVAVLLSSRLGGAVAAADVARERIAAAPPIEIVDSRSVSLGLGFQVLRAAELAGEGADAGAIAAALRAATDRYHVVFSVESVEHLRQSGRIGRSAAMIAEALQLKPLLRLDEGQIVPYERVRTRARAIAELTGFVCALPAVERVAVLTASGEEEAREMARLVVAETGLPPQRVTLAQIGPTVAAQVGPGALGVAVVEPEGR
jgi:DegV family protein with EDD domain